MINNKHTTCSDKIGKGMIKRRRLATDYTNFTHKSHIFKGISRSKFGTTCSDSSESCESLRYVHRFKTTFGCFICANSKKSVKQICVN